jgi:outer membrane protein OmpA-like peptidoglycan-associated protein
MNHKIYLLLISLLTLISSCSVAQPGRYSSSSKKAIKLYESGRSCFNEIDPKTGQRSLECAETELLKAIDKDPAFSEAYSLLSNVYVERGDLTKAISYKEQMLQKTSTFSQSEYFYLSSMLMAQGEYEKCIGYANKYLLARNPNPTFVNACHKYIQNSKFGIEAKKHPFPYEPINMGTQINTRNPEYFPSLTADDSTLLFTRTIDDNRVDFYKKQEDIFITTKKSESIWELASPVSSNINTVANEGAPTLSADGKYIIMVGCATGPNGEYGKGREGYGSCDLFVSERIGKEWTTPVNMGKTINSGHWETQPCFSSDGKTLYFIRGLVKSRERRDPKNQDIYVTEILSNGTWSTPKKLGANINTPGREESVQIHPDGQTLYFSSDGHPGMGGQDLYMSRMDATGRWGRAVNLGYPINTHKDENSLLVSSGGEVALFASDREGGYGDLDLYSFNIPKQYQPIETTFIKGLVYDENTKEPLAAKFQLIDLKTGKIFKAAIANSGSGDFMVALPKNKDFALIAEHDGYFFFSKNYSIDKLTKSNEGFLVNVPMNPIKSGDTFVLENIFFDVSKYELKTESVTELEKLKKILSENKSMKIELGGHTDSDGDDAKNQTLSENRAKAVVNWLIENGIDKSRLSYKGYGESQPIVPNDSSENKAKNRRTEVRVL